MEAQSIDLIKQNALTATNILLMHTVGAIAQIVVAAILGRTLITLRREGRVPKGFFSIAAFISFSSFLRAVRLFYTWMRPLPPSWLNALTLLVLFITMLTIPIILSTHYVEDSSLPGWRWTAWVWRAMITNVLCVIATFIIAILYRSAHLIPLVCCVALIISVTLLLILTSNARSLQIRRRGLTLFASLTSIGLLGIAANLFLGFIAMHRQFHHVNLATALEWSTASQELSNIFIVLGTMFVFASLRLSDVLVKEVLKLYIWCLIPLCGWGIVTEIYSRFENRIIHDATLSLGAVAFLACLTASTHALGRKSDEWVDKWVFQVPSFGFALQRFADRLRSIEDIGGVYGASEDIVRTTLSVAAVRIVSSAEVAAPCELATAHAHPFFLPEDSTLRSTSVPAADVVAPLIRDGVIDYWMTLSQGAARPPLTFTELDFVGRVAAEIQSRVVAIQAEKVRLERQQREAAFRAEITSAELRALRAQINPHFLFNSLNTIADLSITEPRKAEEMTLRLAAVFRYVLVNGDQQFITVSEELEFVRSYLDIEQTRFEDRLKVQFNVEPSAMRQQIPTLLLQPLVENAIRHGISPRMQGGTLKISAKQIADGIQIIVADDGVGLSSTYRQKSSKRSTNIGLNNTERRLRAAYGDKASFTLKPGEGGGTEAVITIICDMEDA